MPQLAENNHYLLEKAKILVLSFIVIFLVFAWQGNKRISLADEGFLWYGAQRVMLGEVPIRDFMAYDPGRYYWSAALMAMIGDNGIMSLRAAVAVFQALGLFVGLLLISQSAKGRGRDKLLFLIACTATLMVWMYPRHKLFDISLSIFLIGVLTYLIQNPVPRSYYITGICVGLVSVFGRNHGVYGVAGSFGTMLWLCIKRTTGPSFYKGFVLWVCGVISGFAPIIFMVLALPGFGPAFWESIRFLFEQKATNLPLPVPWPWTVNFKALSPDDAIRGLLVGLFFIGILAFGALGILWAVIQRTKGRQISPTFVASVFLALPYAHFAFSRSDVPHLAQGIFPLIVGCLTIFSTKNATIKWPLTIALCSASMWVIIVFHPGWKCRVNGQYKTIEISGDFLQVEPGMASNIALLRRLADRYAPDGRNFIVTPFWPGAYPLLQRRSPMWEIYALFPRPETFQRKEIERIRKSRPAFALVLDRPLDRRDELRFKNTHPLIYRHILDNFDPAPNSPNPIYQIFKAKDVK